MSLTKVTYSMIVGSPANVLDFGADATGVTDSTAAIQAAINSGAGVVIFPEGTFVTGALAPANGVSLVGAGREKTVLKLKNAANSQLFNGASIASFTIQGFEIDGNKTNQSSAANLIQFFSSSNISVVDNFIHDASQDAVYFTGCDNCLVQFNDIKDNDRNGVSCGAAVDTSTNMRILNNTIAGHTGTNDIGISLEPSAKSLVSGNVLIDNYDSINLAGDAAQTIDCNENIVSDNIITTSAATCLRGIVTSGTSATTGSNLFSGNKISGNFTRGIVALSTNGSTFSENVVEGLTGANNSAIELFTCEKCVVSNNRASGADLYGIYLDGSDNNAVVGNFTENNSVLGPNVRDGIRLQDSSYNVVTGNYSSGPDQAFGIKENGTVTYNVFSGNNVEGNATSGYSLVTGSWTTIDGKWFSSAAPLTGTWAIGDIVYNTAPTPGGTIGWVCTTAGTPGTWKTFGTIAV